MSDDTNAPSTNRINFGGNKSHLPTAAELAQSEAEQAEAAKNDKPSVAPETAVEAVAEAEAPVAEVVAEDPPEAAVEETAVVEEEVRPMPTIEAEVVEGESLDDLRAKQDEIARKIAERRTSEHAAVIEQIKTVVATYDISVAELVEALGGLKHKRVGSKAKPKYRNPEDGSTWSGRGKPPLWIKDKDREPFLITD